MLMHAFCLQLEADNGVGLLPPNFVLLPGVYLVTLKEDPASAEPGIYMLAAPAALLMLCLNYLYLKVSCVVHDKLRENCDCRQ